MTYTYFRVKMKIKQSINTSIKKINTVQILCFQIAPLDPPALRTHKVINTNASLNHDKSLTTNSRLLVLGLTYV